VNLGGFASEIYRASLYDFYGRYYYTITAVNQFGESVASSEVSMTWGRAVVSDFDGNRVSDPAVFRPSTGEWYILRSGPRTGMRYVWGGDGDVRSERR
jgi:hypothetical protein